MEKKVMMKIPLFDKIVIGKKAGKRYYMIPISDDDVDYIKQKFIIEDSFVLELNDFVISSYNIVMFGDSRRNTKSIEHKLEDVITSTGVLTVPSDIDKDKLEMSNKITPGVPATRVYEFCVCQIGNPKNVLIFKNGNYKSK